MNLQSNQEVKASADQPFSVYSRLVRADISHGAFRLWHLLLDHRNKATGLAWPSQETIAKLMHCKIDSLKSWTTELVESGFLKTERRGQRHYLVYTFPLVFPEWVGRDNSGNPPKGETTIVASPKQGWPRTPPKGRQTETREPIIPISNSRLLSSRPRPAELAYQNDGYIREKIAMNDHLSDELGKGKSRLSLELGELYALNPARARELVGDAMTKRVPAAWLNKAVSHERSMP